MRGPLHRAFYDRDPVVVARNLLGKHLVREFRGTVRVGRIVEVEAYLGPTDLASHASKGRTARTSVLFGPPGHAYVYLIYGLYWCTNIVTQAEGVASGVLLRALEPVKNIHGSATGPGRLSRAMHISGSSNAHDLVSEDFYIAPGRAVDDRCVVRSRRIGVEYAGRWAVRRLRFFIKGTQFVSHPRIAK